MNALKLKTDDNINTVKGLKETVKSWLESITVPFESYDRPIDELEFERRDGFIPHSWNRGGLDLIAISDISSLVGSGEHMGLSIEEWINDQYNEAGQDAIKEGLIAGTDEYYEFVDNNTQGDYSCIAYRIRVMYEGEGILKIYSGYDKDAPYFRWNGKAEFETEIKFKSIDDLNKKLKKVTKKLEKAQ